MDKPTIDKPRIESWPIEKLHEWDKNPRTITPEAFERLKKQITELGIYKPLLVSEDGTVLGGNMRLKAFVECGLKTVVVSIVKADTDLLKIKYALSDNDQVGTTDRETLLVHIENLPELNLQDYAAHFDEPNTLSNFMKQFTIGVGEGEKEIDETLTTTNKCPKCGYEW